MIAPLDSLNDAEEGGRNYESPPLHLWHPECNGDMPIFINSRGEWYHNGGKIKRDSLVRLFASILRREDDGEYYLVTPHEKWRIEVEHHAFLVTDISVMTRVNGQVMEACLNTGKYVSIDKQHPLYLDETMGGIAAMHLPHRLTAVCTRSAWYRLIDMADTADGAAILRSGNYEFKLSTD
jgi:hypothetical protein